MNRQELRVFLEASSCHCGQAAAAAKAMLRLLRVHPLHNEANSGEFEEWLPDDGVRTLLLYELDRLELTEHGGSVGGGWLTEKGEAVRDALAREEHDDFAELIWPYYCVHGYDVDDEAHDCSAGSNTSPPADGLGGK